MTPANIVQWLFAVFMAIVSAFGALVAMVFLFLLVLGIPIGTKPPLEVHPDVNPTIFWILVTSMFVLPLFVASYVGAITVPNSQLWLAAIIFPLSTFLLINVYFSLGVKSRGVNPEIVLETAAGCAAAAACLYFRWKRRQSKRKPTENTPEMGAA
jgi:hypothetical protein